MKLKWTGWVGGGEEEGGGRLGEQLCHVMPLRPFADVIHFRLSLVFLVFLYFFPKQFCSF